MNLRTDLALERRELASEEDSDGIFFREYSDRGIAVTEINVYNGNGVRKLGKPEGTYITFDVTPFSRGTSLFSSPELFVISDRIKRLLPEGEGTVLVAGLGNAEMTADALGPKTASMIFSTRHIGAQTAADIGLDEMRSVAAISTGVLGKTGIETVEMIESVAGRIKPCAVITVDALAARRLERIGTTVQISTSGIVPGSGVGNSRRRIDEETVGVPVISVGVPTVVDAATFAYDIMSEKGGISEEEAQKLSAGITVTPKDIDIMIERASRLVAMSINRALQDSLSPEEIFAIVSQ